jgi:ketosteroid isomerase-like protein
VVRLRFAREVMGANGRNLEIVRAFFDASRAYFRGEHERFEAAVAEHCRGDITMMPSSALATGHPGPFRGHGDLISQQNSVRDLWPDFDVSVDEFVDVPPNAVVALGRVSARKGNGVGYAMEIGIIYRLEGGKIVSMNSYQSKRRALERAGGPELVARVASE